MPLIVIFVTLYYTSTVIVRPIRAERQVPLCPNDIP